MRLLITTQTVDPNDPYLGFFHEWILGLAPHFESIEVICLNKGNHTLPKNVRVHSLGKESGRKSRMEYMVQFWMHAWRLRNSYDAVCVHMNPEYIVLAGWWWKLVGKKICLWYNHPKAGMRLALAMLAADKVFHTSPLAASAGSRKSIRMPAGVDTELFSSQGGARTTHSIYLQGRVMQSKRINAACEAVMVLIDRGIHVTLTIVGPEDVSYADGLRRRYKSLIEKRAVSFLGPKPNKETPALYSAHAVALNLASGGHYDKTVLEAMACETPVIITSRAFAGRVPEMWSGKETPLQIADALQAFFALSLEEQRALGAKEREAVQTHESLKALIEALSRELHS